MTGKGILAVTMPKWGMTMTEGTVVRWLADEGEGIDAGSEFIEIETTKIINVVEAQAGGTLRRRLVQAGSTVPVGTLLGVVAAEHVSDEELDAFVAGYTPADVVAEDASAAGPQARIVEAEGRAINVASMGDAGEHMLMLHGFGGDLNSWMFNQPPLSADFVVHALDLPGHGQSTLDVASGSVPDLAATIVAVLDAMEIEEAHLVGHSLGGAIALFATIKRPERVLSASLVCPGGLGTDINLEFIDGFIAADRRKAMKSVLGQLFADPDAVQRKMVEESLKYKRLDGVPAALQAIRQSNFTDTGQAGGMRDAVGSLKAPMQIIWGTEDRVIPANQMKDLPEAIATHLIEGAGHMPHMEQASEVTRLIAGFAKQAEV